MVMAKENITRGISGMLGEVLTVGALIRTANFSDLDDAFFITAFVMGIQVLLFLIEKVFEDTGTRKKLNFITIISAIVVVFVCFSNIWQSWFCPSIWHVLILALLLLARYRMWLDYYFLIKGACNE